MLKGLEFSKVTLLWNKEKVKEFGVVFSKKEASITNPAFKLVKNFTFYIFAICYTLACIRLAWGTFGSIYCKRSCDRCKDDEEKEIMVSKYCWISPTYTFPDAHASVPGMPGVGLPPKHNAGMKYIAYYPWVPYVLFLQSILICVPAKLWAHLEGGRMRHFRTCGGIEIKVLDTSRNEKIDTKIRKIATALLNYQKYGLNYFYSYYYVFCEILNLVTIAFNLWFTDFFLSGEFGTIGFDIIGRMMSQDTRTDVLAFTFPKVTKCVFRSFGPTRSIVFEDYYCVLPINEAYEKIYILIWFLLWTVLMTCSLALVYRLALIISPGFRRYTLSRQMTLQDRRLLNDVLMGLGYSDWFMLKLVADNFNMIRFGHICTAMRDMNHVLSVKVDVKVDMNVKVNVVKTPVKKYTPVKRCSDYINQTY